MRFDKSALTYCPKQRPLRSIAWCRQSPAMSSFHYSTPTPPPRRKLEDMILYYAFPSMRAELVADFELWEDLTNQAETLIGSWQPTTPWHRELVSHGRSTQWLIWQVANSRCPEMVNTFCDDDVVEPWAIEIDTLANYDTDLMPFPKLVPGAPEL